MEAVRVKVTIEEAMLKIAWSESKGGFRAYYIDQGLIKREAEEVRNKLGHFVEEARINGITQIDKYLKALVEVGNRLYRALFDADKHQVKRIQTWLNNKPKPFHIHFTVDSRVHIPWGLIYDGERSFPDENSGDFNIDKYQDFWCLKYSLSTTYSRIEPPLDEKIPAKKLKILPLFHKGVYDKVIPELKESEKNAMAKIFSNFSELEIPLFTRTQFFTTWNAIAHNNTLIYICCHADETRLALNADDSISIDDLRLDLQLEEPYYSDNINFMFMNGCSTAVGRDDGGFLEATGKEGFYGFIGVETKVPDIFAVRFGLEFMASFIYSGKPVYEIMHDLRQRHWPLSLIYATYCYPTLTVSPLPEKKLSLNFDQKNFFFERVVGSDVL